MTPFEMWCEHIAHRAAIAIRPVAGDAEYWRIRATISRTLSEGCPPEVVGALAAAKEEVE